MKNISVIVSPLAGREDLKSWKQKIQTVDGFVHKNRISKPTLSVWLLRRPSQHKLTNYSICRFTPEELQQLTD